MKPIQLDFKPSIIGTVLFGLMSLGTVAIVMLMEFSWHIKLLLNVVILVAAMTHLLQHAWRMLPWSCVGLDISNKNALTLVRKDGQKTTVTVLPSTTVTPYLTVINCHIVGANFMQRLFNPNIVIFADAIDAEQYRQLRVWLRWAHESAG